MKPLFPNLELIEHKATELALLDNHLSSPPEFNLLSFTQIWGSTCTGFDLTSDGLPAIGGSAMTKEYTTVAHELKTDVYYIFFGNRPCYKVTEAGKNFFDDLKHHRMASLSQAKQRYIDEKDTSKNDLLGSILELRDFVNELQPFLNDDCYADLINKTEELQELAEEVIK